ncbi:MAG: hypothetical protein Q8N47_12630 [Bryobacterales bacterium]|nr:hypothetical protein [Bryobacterales bacterium]
MKHRLRHPSSRAGQNNTFAVRHLPGEPVRECALGAGGGAQ